MDFRLIVNLLLRMYRGQGVKSISKLEKHRRTPPHITSLIGHRSFIHELHAELLVLDRLEIEGKSCAGSDVQADDGD